MEMTRERRIQRQKDTIRKRRREKKRKKMRRVGFIVTASARLQFDSPTSRPAVRCKRHRKEGSGSLINSSWQVSSITSIATVSNAWGYFNYIQPGAKNIEHGSNNRTPAEDTCSTA